MKEKIQRKLLLWSCTSSAETRAAFALAASENSATSGLGTATLQAELKVLKTQTEAAFKDASEALKCSQQGTANCPSYDAR